MKPTPSSLHPDALPRRRARRHGRRGDLVRPRHVAGSPGRAGRSRRPARRGLDRLTARGGRQRHPHRPRRPRAPLLDRLRRRGGLVRPRAPHVAEALSARRHRRRRSARRLDRPARPRVGPFRALSYDPASNRWRRLPAAPTTRGFAVWTGRELIGWGGGCCGDAFSDGSAYNPSTNHWRRLAHSPLAGSQHPLAAWTGHELIVLVGNRNPDTGKPWPARLARAAAYNPATNGWRRIAPLPAAVDGESVASDGHELIAAGGSSYGARSFSRSAFAYDPSANRWRRIPRCRSHGRAHRRSGTGTSSSSCEASPAPTGRRRARSARPAHEPLARPAEGRAPGPPRLGLGVDPRRPGRLGHLPDRDVGQVAPGRRPVRPEGCVVTIRAACGVSLAVVLFSTVAARALACGDGGSMNDVASPAVKSALVDAFVTAHPRLDLRPSEVTRLAGHTYYGTMGGSAYAVATFVARGHAWQPTILASYAGRRWHVIRQTHGGICTRWVPRS